MHMAAFQRFHAPFGHAVCFLVLCFLTKIESLCKSQLFYFVQVKDMCVIIKKKKKVFTWLSSNSFSNITVLGSKRERGLLALDKEHLEDPSNTLGTEEVYDLPFGISSYLSSKSWVGYIPFCPPRGNRTLYRSDDNTMSQGQGVSKGTEVIKEFAL